MNLSDRSIPLEERVRDFLERPPGGTRLDVISMVAQLAEAFGAARPVAGYPIIERQQRIDDRE